MADLLPGLNVSTDAPVYVKGLPVETLGQALAQRDPSARGGYVDFWASPERPASSPVQEVLEVGLSVDRIVNRISLRLAKYPCEARFQYLDEQDAWQTMKDRSGRALSARITASVPAVISGTQIIPANSNVTPQHSAPGHWEDFDLPCAQVYSRCFRVVLRRLPSPHVPLDDASKPIDYSLAVMDLDLGFRMLGRGDLPATTSDGQYLHLDQEPAATSQDLLGSSVDYFVRDYPASALNWPVLQAEAGVSVEEREDSSVWRSEPMPRADAVIPLYIDARDALGEAQVIDSFDVDPLTSGVRFNLYHSSDEPSEQQAWTATDEYLRAPAVKAVGSIVVDQDGLLFEGTASIQDPSIDRDLDDVFFVTSQAGPGNSVAIDSDTIPYITSVASLPGSGVQADTDGIYYVNNRPGTGSYIEIENSAIQWNSRRPWWMAISIEPQFTSDSSTTRVVFDSAALRIFYSNGVWFFRFGTQVVALPAFAFTFNARMNFVVGRTANGRYEVRHEGTTAQVGVLSAPPLNKSLRIGSGLDDEPGKIRLVRMVIKQEPLRADNGLIELFAAYLGTARYAVPPSDDDLTHNALLRVDPVFQSRVSDPSDQYSNKSPYGIRGGPGHAYESLTWTPVNRDFVLAKGALKIDAVKAKYFKFEFTGLVPKPYSSAAPVTRVVKVFPDSVARRGVDTADIADVGSRVNQALGSTIRFSDQRQIRLLATPGYDDYKPTEALYSTDPDATDRLRDLAPVFGLEPWHQGRDIPRFRERATHSYLNLSIQHTTKVAYHVGLRRMEAKRSRPQAAIDSDEYQFDFLDRASLIDDQGAWALDPNSGIRTGDQYVNDATGEDFAVTTSDVLRSRRNVRGLQFASVQTPAKQVLLDADFIDPQMANWRVLGGAEVSHRTNVASVFGGTVHVKRRPTSISWDQVEEQYPTWDSIEESDPSPALPRWNQVTGAGLADLSIGGLESLHYVDMPRGGRMYAAARVYVTKPLTAPLHVQIVGDNGEVLADSTTFIAQGPVVEWYASYTVGEGGGGVDLLTWDEVEDLGTWNDLESVGSWDQVSGAASFQGFDGEVSVRVFQEGETDDEFEIDNISLFEDPIVWEFSNDGGDTWMACYDIRNDPFGSMLFPTNPSLLGVQEGTELRWRVKGFRRRLRVDSLTIRPWYFGPGMGILPSGSLERSGGNLSNYDQFPAVEDSPRFKGWSKPVPQAWWYVYRQWLLDRGVVNPFALPTPSSQYLSRSIVYGETEES